MFFLHLRQPMTPLYEEDNNKSLIFNGWIRNINKQTKNLEGEQ